ncbi:cardiolipin synthase [Bacillus sp. CGMCC 1.16607]|uniref:cardiolipin synthase n=1 Tax=Bacillus sp. CGMCC 1.16607 TaxID=3351842 RepID=UPI0036422759
MNVLFSVLGVIFLLFIWLTLDYQLGRNRHLNHFVFPNAPRRQSHIELFTDGEVLFQDYFGELKKAKHHIHILFYIVADDSFSKEFFLILKQKAAEGVEVRLLLDALGSLKVDREMIGQLKAAGGQIFFCHIPKLPFLFYSSQTRNHRKITVIDGVTGYLGGFNIGKEYVNQDEKLNPWRDFQLKISCEGVHDLQREFLRDWRESTKTDLIQTKTYFPDLEKGTVEHEIIPSEGVYLEKTYVKWIHSAKHTIMIGTPYFIPSKKVFRALRLALKRGVSIIILVPKISDHILVKEASFPYFRMLIPEGATVYQYLKGFYHAKTFMIDTQVCDVGTANFDKRSFFLNHEINCYMYNKDFIKKVKEIYEQDLLDSKILTLEELNRPNLWRSIKERIATVFSLFL